MSQTLPAYLDDYSTRLAALERAVARHADVQVKNMERLRTAPHPHTAAMCQALEALITGFPDAKIVALVEAEIAALGKRSRPEDLVVWIEGVGAVVVEIKSHMIGGIRRFENNIPVVVYQGAEHEDVFLVDQPRTFAFELRAQIELAFDKADLAPPALYWAGWLPRVSPEDIVARGQAVAGDKVWLSDMLSAEQIRARLPRMRTLTGTQGADRNGLELFMRLFGCTAGLRIFREPRAVQPGTLGYQIDLRTQELRRLTKEQEDLAFSPQLLRGPKVIRGVAGSGKTIVLANAVANLLIETRYQAQNNLFGEDGAPPVRALVLCYNRALVDHLQRLIAQTFDALKPESTWIFPHKQIEVRNIDRLFYWLYRKCGLGEYTPTDKDDEIAPFVQRFCEIILPHLEPYTHIFIDEGQDIQHAWYPLIRGLAQRDDHAGPSILLFYDDAQNVYGVRRPGTAGLPAWRELLGAEISPRGLRTIMRVGHRNTNEILSFSFNILLGAFAQHDPQMAGFADLASYVEEMIPDDPQLNHPNAGRACVERLGERRYQINFSLRSGQWPTLHTYEEREAMFEALVGSLEHLTAQDGQQVDPRDILVMAPNKQTVWKLAECLRRRGLKVHVPIKQAWRADGENAFKNPADEPFFQDGTITVSTIKSAKGYGAHVCHLVAVDELCVGMGDGQDSQRDYEQLVRAEFHAGATRALLHLEVWGQPCPLMTEAQQVIDCLRETQRTEPTQDAVHASDATETAPVSTPAD